MCYVTIVHMEHVTPINGPLVLLVLLNQARAWFLKIDPVRIVGMRVCVCVCVSAPEATNN